MRRTNFSDHQQPAEITGKTVAWAGLIKTEYGRVGNYYLLLKFTDGTRQVIGTSTFRYWDPDPDVSQMVLAKPFFTDRDIQAKEDADEARRRLHATEERRRKEHELAQLQKELGHT